MTTCGGICRLFGKLSGFAELIQFLSGQPGFGDHVSLLRETVVQGFVVADADHVADFIPVEIGVQPVAGLRLLGVVQLPVAACQGKPLPVVVQMPSADPVNGTKIPHHGNIHVHIQRVSAVQYFLSYLGPLPGIPLGNAPEFRNAVLCFQLAQRGEGIGFAAAGTGQAGALAQSFSFFAAVGAFVKNSV